MGYLKLVVQKKRRIKNSYALKVSQGYMDRAMDNKLIIPWNFKIDNLPWVAVKYLGGKKGLWLIKHTILILSVPVKIFYVSIHTLEIIKQRKEFLLFLIKKYMFIK